jgi:hypothetical protein
LSFVGEQNVCRGSNETNLVKHDQDVGAAGRFMARRRKGLKVAKYLCDEYLVLNGRSNQTAG